jgi:type I restriction enzyme S subunit
VTYPSVPFTDLLEVIIDNRGRTCPVGSTGRPLIATNCVRNTGLYPSYETDRFVSDETYATWFRGHPAPGDILFVCKGAPGSVAMVPDPVDFCIAQDMVAVRADSRMIEPNYLFAALRSHDVQTQIGAMHVGTMIPHFKKGDFDKLLIPLPPRGIQRLIGDTYVDLSRKIESNRRKAALVQEVLRAETALLASESDRTLLVGDLATSESQRITDQPHDFPYVGLEHMASFDVVLWNHGRASDSKSASRLAPRGAILFGRIRPYFGKVGIAARDCVVAQSIEVLAPRVPHHAAWLLILLSSRSFIDRANSLCTGTTMPQVRWEAVAQLAVSVPDEDRLHAFDSLAGPMVEVLMRLSVENEELRLLRDALLPELLSGRLRVRNAESQLDRAL